jgi:ribonucleoside-diphosphate reductase alpha chain
MSTTLVDKETVTAGGAGNAAVGTVVAGLDPAKYQVERRDGTVVKFKGEKIINAITKAFLAEENLSVATARIKEEVNHIADLVFGILAKRRPNGGTWHIEDIQDQVELALMRVGRPEVAKGYVLYRQERAKLRESEKSGVGNAAAPATPAAEYTVTDASGKLVPLNKERVQEIIREA